MLDPHCCGTLRPTLPPHPLEMHLFICEGERHGLQISEAREKLANLALLHLRGMGSTYSHSPGKPRLQPVKAIGLGRVLEDIPGVHDVRPVGWNLNTHCSTLGPRAKTHPLQAFGQLLISQVKSYQLVGLLCPDCPGRGSKVR